MSGIESLIQDFLSQPCIAVAGVSSTRQTPANGIYRKLRETGHTVYAVNPNAKTVEGDPCYPNLASLPQSVGGVVIVTRPSTAAQIVRQCIECGIPRVWMHNPLGTSHGLWKKLSSSVTSVSDEAVALCHENNIAAIPGTCPMQFCEPVDPAHRCVRWLLRTTGGLK